jgi:Tfp pilus assembly protein FimT
LVELVTVITLLGLIGVAVTGTTMAQFADIRTRSAASRLTGDIRYAQRLSLASGLRTWVTFDVGANNYQLYIEDASNLGKANRVAAAHPFDQSSGPVQFGSGTFSGISIASVNVNATEELEFDSLGVPYDGNSAALATSGVITFSNGVTVTVWPVSGFVERAG